jgi:hypothetical protein
MTSGRPANKAILVSSRGAALKVGSDLKLMRW